jgi:hypothetical protein
VCAGALKMSWFKAQNGGDAREAVTALGVHRARGCRSTSPGQVVAFTDPGQWS